MQPQIQQFYPSQYNPTLHYEQQQGRFDMPHPLEHPYQAQPFALQATSPYATSQHQGLSSSHIGRGTSHPTRHQALRQAARANREGDSIAPMSQFALDSRRPDDPYLRRLDTMLRVNQEAAATTAGGMHISSENQVFTPHLCHMFGQQSFEASI